MGWLHANNLLGIVYHTIGVFSCALDGVYPDSYFPVVFEANHWRSRYFTTCVLDKLDIFSIPKTRLGWSVSDVYGDPMWEQMTVFSAEYWSMFRNDRVSDRIVEKIFRGELKAVVIVDRTNLPFL